MHISISLNYKAQWGQQMFLLLGAEALPMTGHDDGRWSIELDKMPAEGSYRFELKDADGKTIRHEAASHTYKVAKTLKELIIKDKWNDVSEDAPFKSAFFKDVIFKRGECEKAETKGNLTLQICAPTLRPGDRLGVSGDFLNS